MSNRLNSKENEVDFKSNPKGWAIRTGQIALATIGITVAAPLLSPDTAHADQPPGNEPLVELNIPGLGGGNGNSENSNSNNNPRPLDQSALDDLPSTNGNGRSETVDDPAVPPVLEQPPVDIDLPDVRDPGSNENSTPNVPNVPVPSQTSPGVTPPVARPDTQPSQPGTENGPNGPPDPEALPPLNVERIAGLPYFNQHDEPWADIPLNPPGETNGNINDNGCGPTSLAIAITHLTGQLVTPIDMANWMEQNGGVAPGGGSYHRGLSNAAEAYGLRTEFFSSPDIIEDLKNTTDQGGLIISNGRDNDPNTPATSSGHIFVIYHIDENGMFYILDPNSREMSGVPHSPESILGPGTMALEILPNQEAGSNPSPEPTPSDVPDQSDVFVIPMPMHYPSNIPVPGIPVRTNQANIPIPTVNVSPQASAETAPTIETLPEGMPEISRIITQDVVAQMIPDASPEAIAQMYPLVMRALEEQGIADRDMVLYAFSTIRVETGSGMPIPEIGRGGGRYIVGDYDYYGRGYIQLTWDYNYQAAGEALGIDLLHNPDLALDPETAARILAWFLVAGNHDDRLREAFANGDLGAARKVVNGGTNGLERFTESWNTGAGLIG